MLTNLLCYNDLNGHGYGSHILRQHSRPHRVVVLLRLRLAIYLGASVLARRVSGRRGRTGSTVWTERLTRRAQRPTHAPQFIIQASVKG